jgi:hypothetical protein
VVEFKTVGDQEIDESLHQRPPAEDISNSCLNLIPPLGLRAPEGPAASKSAGDPRMSSAPGRGTDWMGSCDYM